MIIHFSVSSAFHEQKESNFTLHRHSFFKLFESNQCKYLLILEQEGARDVAADLKSVLDTLLAKDMHPGAENIVQELKLLWDYRYST